MTISEILQSIVEIREQFAWKLAPDAGPHAERRATPRLHIQGTPEADPTLELEPLHALCYVKTGNVFGPHAWVEIGKILDLSASEVADIEAAGKDRTWRATGGTRQPLERLLALRRQLLEAVGIESHEKAG